MGADDIKKDKKSKDKSEKKDKKISTESGVKKEKKDKKKDKVKQDKLASALDRHLTADTSSKAEEITTDATATATTPKKSTKSVVTDPEDLIKTAEELVPFALPLADDKAHKKIYKLIKKGAKLKAIHRGVKECEKAIKKTPLKKTGVTSSTPPPGLVIIAADISPMDVIMHFPILCEEHGVPYIYVRSRADLGVAACTKRATSVVMLRMEGKAPSGAAAKKDEDADMEDGENKKVSPEEYADSWRELVKLAEKQWTSQVEPWVKGTHPLQLASSA